MSRSVGTLQRAMVRMLYDPAYVTRVRAGPVPGLSEAERALLARVDPRAWSTDAHRRARGVTALVEELPVTAAILGVPGVDAFFSDEAFAACLADRASMALAFGSWSADRAARDVARLETAAAAARRALPRRGSGLARSPGVEVAVVDAAAVRFWHTWRARLTPDPAARVAALRGRIAPPERSGETEALIFERSVDGTVAVGGASEALVQVLAGADPARPREQVEALVVACGADPADAPELVDDWLAEGLLAHH